ncbi:hypothetical protein KQH60_01610 [Mycetohabitans sp. B8]|uniref:hypothetical protein n=1 Tax=Mycetohabitans sp. B8 TaxID=2841845 RepID=UPI001F2836A2|nr:hypothetical protein [Mycetohabitans sp. B8]MCG1041329.1 hypothetical protein [Mycetohabitans sp. B8]
MTAISEWLQMHAGGVRIYIGTLTPADLPASREAVRSAVNDWIRKQHPLDGVIDSDPALRDAAHPTRMAAPYDNGERVHPSDAGQAIGRWPARYRWRGLRRRVEGAGKRLAGAQGSWVD